MLAQVFWNSPRSLPGAVVVGLVTVVAVLWLYPPQVKGLAWHWRWGLPMLRAGGMLALAVALLKPSVLRPKTSDEQGAVIVLVDRSRSMAVADNARTPGQLVALADGMGRIPAGVRSAAAAEVAARAAQARPRLAAVERAIGDLEYARVAGRGVEAARDRVDAASRSLLEAAGAVRAAVLLLPDPAARAQPAGLGDVPRPEDADAGARLAALRASLDTVTAAATQAQSAADEQLYRSNPHVRAACDDLAARNRFSLAEESLLRPGSGLLAMLGAGTTVVGFAFADDLSPLPLGGQGRRAATRPSTAAAAAPGSPATSPAPAALNAAPDGRSSDLAGSVRKALDLLENRDVAAVVLVSDGRQAGAEAAITSGLGASGVPVFPVAVAPPGAVRDVAVAGVTAPPSAFVGETVTVRAEVRGQGLRDLDVQVTLAVEGAPEQVRPVRLTDGRPAVVEMQFKVARAGAQAVTVSLAGVPGEATAENNSARRWVKVLSQKVAVAAYAALPGWDFQYLRNALSRTPWVDLRAAVLNPAAPRVPLSPDDILRQDVLVLADVPVAALDDAQWGAAYRLASERGGSVVLVAGPAHVPVEYGPHLVASSLLPYPPDMTPAWRMWPGEAPMFRLVPHPDAAGESFLRLGGGAGAPGAQRWQTLPGFYRVLPVGRLKPSAQPLLVEASSGEPVLTQMRVGAGRAFLFGADETWRWRNPSADDAHDRFWLQLTRFAAGEPYAARSERLALDVDRVAFEAGESVQAKVRTLAGGAESFRLEVVKDGATYRTLNADPSGGDESGRFRARVGPLPEGDYELRLTEAGGGTAGALSLPLRVTAGYETELADVSADDSVLARLAEASGGEVYRLDQVNQLAERLRATTERRSRFVEQRLWDSPYLFVLVVACFAAEWAARKRVGLA